MKFQNIAFLGLVVFLFASCATAYKVSSDYEKGVDFSPYKTFKMAEQESGFPLGANPINKQRIDRAILKEMNNLGFESSESPDLLVSWFVKVEDVRGVDYYRDYYGRWHAPRHAYVYEYQKGTLVIDLVDKAKNQVVWHGKTSRTVYEDMQDVEEKINKAVNAILQKFAKDTGIDKSVVTN